MTEKENMAAHAVGKRTSAKACSNSNSHRSSRSFSQEMNSGSRGSEATETSERRGSVEVARTTQSTQQP